MRISDWSSDVCSSDLVVVVNHHLLFADLALKQEGFGEILPGAAAFILDEAHQIPELAGQFFSQSVSARQLTEQIGRASCRERVCKYFEIAVVAVCLKKT